VWGAVRRLRSRRRRAAEELIAPGVTSVTAKLTANFTWDFTVTVAVVMLVI
jgi:hypothetical protein